jgi:hypothetical protein
MAAVLRMDAAQDLEAGEDIEAAIEPAAVWHRIDVTANEQGGIGCAPQSRPGVAGLVVVHFHREVAGFFPQPRTRLRPSRRESDTLRAVFVAGQSTQFFQFAHHALWVEAHPGRIRSAESPAPARKFVRTASSFLPGSALCLFEMSSEAPSAIAARSG